jgi:hypothetical protein
MHVTCPANLTLLELLILIIYGEQWESQVLCYKQEVAVSIPYELNEFFKIT